MTSAGETRCPQSEIRGTKLNKELIKIMSKI